MSLDITLYATPRVAIYSNKISDNLSKMAEAAGIYQYLWTPEELQLRTAGELVEQLQAALTRLRRNEKHYRKFESSHGWGTYEHFISFLEDYLKACEDNPAAQIEISR